MCGGTIPMVLMGQICHYVALQIAQYCQGDGQVGVELLVIRNSTLGAHGHKRRFFLCAVLRPACSLACCQDSRTLLCCCIAPSKERERCGTVGRICTPGEQARCQHYLQDEMHRVVLLRGGRGYYPLHASGIYSGDSVTTESSRSAPWEQPCRKIYLCTVSHGKRSSY